MNIFSSHNTQGGSRLFTILLINFILVGIILVGLYYYQSQQLAKKEIQIKQDTLKIQTEAAKKAQQESDYEAQLQKKTK